MPQFSFSSIQFSMDQFDITLCDIGLYEKEYLVQRPALDFGDSAGVRWARRARLAPDIYVAAGPMIPWLTTKGKAKDAA
jgi:hypothetical protein